MHFHFLVEDPSGAVLIEQVMQKITALYPDVTYYCKGYHGMGGFTKRNTVKETKEGKLLNDLATVLRGLNKSLQHIPAAIIVVMDNDTRDTADFLAQLQAVAAQQMIMVDHVFCIAVEEMEAWLLGDEQALLNAYPSAKSAVLHTYVQDSICGTWEVLADAIYPGGLSKFKKDCPSFIEIGLYKSQWAREIGQYMDLEKNRSPSFQNFMNEILKRVST